MKRKKWVVLLISMFVFVLCMNTILCTNTAKAGSVITKSLIDMALKKYQATSGKFWTYNSSVKGASTAWTGSDYAKNKGAWVGYGSEAKAFFGGTQCWGFAEFVGWAVTGGISKSDTPWQSNKWKKYTDFDAYKKVGVDVGDVIHFEGHSVIVYEVFSNGSFKVAECWGSQTNEIYVGWVGKKEGNSSLNALKKNKGPFRAAYKYTGTKVIQPDNPSSNFAFTDVKGPANYKVGSKGGYPLSGGKLVSNEKLKTITSVIKKADGAAISGPTTINIPEWYTYEIQRLDTFSSGDNGVKFSKITQNGNYVWALTATDAAGRSLTLEIPFTASSSATTSQTVSKPYPGNDTEVSSITLNEGNATISKGSTLSLVATIYPSNATNKNVTWSSNNQSVATVDSNGTVQAVGYGTAIITATTVSGGKTATCTITVPDNTVLEFRNVTCPVNYKIGSTNGYLLSGGTLVSNEELKSITSTIKKADGTIKSGPKTVNLSGKGKSFSIKALDTMVSGEDNGVKFSWIKEPGDYIWVLTATDASKSLTLEMPFTASSNATSSHNVSKPYVSPTGVSLDKTDVVMETGETTALKATVSPDNAANKGVRWNSNEISVAVVDENGLITAVAPGTATITVTTLDGGKTASCTVTVLSADVPVESVWLDRDTIGLTEGETETLTATIYPDNATNKNVSWKSSNTSVATVDGNGTVTAVAAGSATITVTTEDGGKTDECTVVVFAGIPDTVPVESVLLNRSELALSEGEMGMLGATIYPDNATNKNVSWKSSNTSVATVDGNGTVMAVAAGSAIITVTTEDGGKTDECTVVVVSRMPGTVPVESVLLSRSELTLTEGEKDTLGVTIYPDNATNKNVSWKSADISVAVVDGNGTVIAVAAGSVKITVTTEDGGKTAVCTVTVVPATVPVESVLLSRSELTLTEGEKDTLGATIYPANATNKKVTWSSSDSSVATVDASGKVTAVSSGNATITVTTEDGQKTACCTVTVDPKDKVEAFVTRCYRIILGRKPDATGLAGWTQALKNNTKTASEIINGFMGSDEFKGKKHSADETVEILYKAMLDRASDAGGKAAWVAKLAEGNPVSVVINGFCTSTEFKQICSDYGITPGLVANDPNTPVQTETEKIKAFVTRCYSIILGRNPDTKGLDDWTNQLATGTKAASEIIDGFMGSNEFRNKNYSIPDIVEILYKAMLGRGSDANGKAAWVAKLEEGHPIGVVINGFCTSKEFGRICSEYGIKPGSVTIDPNAPLTPVTPAVTSEQRQKIQGFVTRCYKLILSRTPDQKGLNDWTDLLCTRTKTAAEIINGFVSSKEFQNKNLSRADAVEILYKTMLGRGSDAKGKAYWVEKLSAGQPIAVIINGFCTSAEFNRICSEYGIAPGTVNITRAAAELVYRQEDEPDEPVRKEPAKGIIRVEITGSGDTGNDNIGTSVQAVYVNIEKAKEYISRCYRIILGREAGQAEIENWITRMMNENKTLDQITRSILFSNEFKNKNTGNEDLVKILYKVYLNREADQKGFDTWVGMLNNGKTLQEVLDAFSKTSEFKTMMSSMMK